jgi:hypothetical protein
MNSLPPDQRGAGAGMLDTFQNSASVLSMAVFFTIITLGLAASLPSHLFHGLVAQGVPANAAHAVANLPPIGSLFAAFLGDNAIQLELSRLGMLHSLPATHAAYLTGREFFPRLISAPFAAGLHPAMYFAAATSLIAAGASLLRGGRYVHRAEPLRKEIGEGLAGAGEAADGIAAESFAAAGIAG